MGFLRFVLMFSCSFFLPYMLWAQSTGLEAEWDDGLEFKSKDGLYKFAVGGKVHYDMAYTGQSKALDTLYGKSFNAIEVRRARISFEGSLNDVLAYEFEFAFGEELEYADMYVAFLRVPVFDQVTLGHFREPFGLEELTSSSSVVFMERSLTSAFGPSRNTGVMVQKRLFDKKLTGYLGAFRVVDDLGSDLEGAGNHSVSGRLAFVPVDKEDENKLLHLGIGVNSFQPTDNEFEVKTENETHSGFNYINSGKLKDVKKISQLGGEFGFTKNKLFIMSEYVHSSARLAKVSDNLTNVLKRNYSSYYIMASYFLKGGIREYDKSGNKFSDISMTKPTEEGRMRGAWEVGLRYSHINLKDTPEQIKKMSDATFALNWYYNSKSRIMLNYIYSRIQDKYNANTLQLRLQVSF